ncbi:MAG TPA: hypothetical protein VK633_02695, partial [Verrucomicrobiae bacterium]|nr:hypothetical protein [Verrucomicrobiae bacterium]
GTRFQKNLEAIPMAQPPQVVPTNLTIPAMSSLTNAASTNAPAANATKATTNAVPAEGAPKPLTTPVPPTTPPPANP